MAICHVTVHMPVCHVTAHAYVSCDSVHGSVSCDSAHACVSFHHPSSFPCPPFTSILIYLLLWLSPPHCVFEIYKLFFKTIFALDTLDVFLCLFNLWRHTTGLHSSNSKNSKWLINLSDQLVCSCINFNFSILTLSRHKNNSLGNLTHHAKIAKTQIPL